MRALSEDELKVIRFIFNAHTPTRISAARDVKYSLIKVSEILNLLEKDGFIDKAVKTESRAGRPSHIYRLRADLWYSIGVFLLPDSFSIVVVDSGKNLVFEKFFTLRLSSDPHDHTQNIVDQLSKTLNDTISRELPAKRSIMAVGLALPGMVDTVNGIWLQGLQLTGITNVKIGELIGERLRVPVFIEDCSRAVTFLEKIGGSGRPFENFILIYLGLGMGAGIVIDNRIYRGFCGTAGEIGHIVHAGNTYRCSCNNVGCLETVASTHGILRVFRDRLADGVRSSLQRFAEEDLSLGHILAAAQEGDRLARITLREIGSYLGDACAISVKLYNPQAIVISGPGSVFKEFFQDSVSQALQHQVITEILENFCVLFTDYEPNHEAYGAALTAFDRFLCITLLTGGGC